jgi:biopolymer transport protein ExbD
MRSSLQQRLDEQHRHGIDLSPLIDVVFILLIFFIVTTVFVRETGVNVDKPKAASSAQLQNELILIAITADDDVVYDRTNIGVGGVRSTVSALLREQQRPVVIQADRRVSTQLLVDVIDEAKLAGAQSINLATVTER